MIVDFVRSSSFVTRVFPPGLFPPRFHLGRWSGAVGAQWRENQLLWEGLPRSTCPLSFPLFAIFCSEPSACCGNILIRFAWTLRLVSAPGSTREHLDTCSRATMTESLARWSKAFQNHLWRKSFSGDISNCLRGALPPGDGLPLRQRWVLSVGPGVPPVQGEQKVATNCEEIV